MKLNLKTISVLTFAIVSPVLCKAQSKHTVKAKETLYSISRKYSITVDQVKKWNRLKSNDLAIGQVLVVSDPFVKTKETEIFEEIKASAEYHIVKKGESLFSISKKYSISVADIKRINDLKSNSLAIGQKLVINIPESKDLLTSQQSEFLNLESFNRHIVKSDESLQDILDIYSLEKSELQALNQDIDLSKLIEGQTINVIQASRIVYANPYLVTTAKNDVVSVIPTFIYSSTESGNVGTSGELISNQEYTLAHQTLPFGTIVQIINTTTNRSILARVTDRTTENAIKITEAIKNAIEFNPMAQHELVLYTLSK
ncbi:LysM peptidoglycan-binding domain-containing protein [bacterium]|nr:MAG: LysM peptidoglycan-binding domain-containing protein [bacterium]